MTQNPTIKLPPERVDQLKAIGAKLNLSMADTVGYLIRAEIAKGTIPATLPGVVITKVAKGVSIGFDGDAPAIFTPANASKFASAIAGVAAGTEPGIASLDADFVVVGAGNGVKIATCVANTPKPFARDVAKDLAALIEAAA